MFINCYIFKYLTMKEDDNGIFMSKKENLNSDTSPKETEDKSDISDKNSQKSEGTIENKIEEPKIKNEEQDKNKMRQKSEIKGINNKEKVKNIKIIKLIGNNKEIKNDKNQINLKNCINKIDLDKNLIVLNKSNLKEINVTKKELNKKNKTTSKKGEIINIFANNKFYYTNKDINNTINKSYDIYTKKFENSNEIFGSIKFNMKFPNDVIEKFFERKKNKKKENKDNNNYINSFGVNPLERLKEIQEKINDEPPTIKNGKLTIKQFKTNQKKLKEEDSKIQNYIKFFPVFNSIDQKIFKSNQFYYYNRINDDKNNYYNKFHNNKNKVKEEIDKEKEESEEDTINRHIKKKFVNKKRNRSKNKENKNNCEI